MGIPAPDALARLAELHRDTFVIDESEASTVDLAAQRGECSLEELDLDTDEGGASAGRITMRTP